MALLVHVDTRVRNHVGHPVFFVDDKEEGRRIRFCQHFLETRRELGIVKVVGKAVGARLASHPQDAPFSLFMNPVDECLEHSVHD